MIWVAVIVVMVAVFVGYLVLTNTMTRRDTMQGRLDRLTDSMQATGGAAGEEPFDMDVEQRSGLAAMLEGMFGAFGITADGLDRPLMERLYNGGINSADGIIYYQFLKRIGLPVFSVVVLIPTFFGFMSDSTAGSTKLLYLAALVFLVLLGVKGADIYLTNRIQKRQKALERSFPDALDLLLVCVESGLALDGALARVCRELGNAHPEITNELNRTRLELTLLTDRTQALQNLANRTGLIPFKSLVAALIQTEKFGTSLADTLRVLSEDYRLTRLAIAENKAGRLPVLMTIPVILLMLPSFIIIIVGPPIIKVVDQGGIFGR